MPHTSHMSFDTLPPAAKDALADYLRELASKGGKAGSHEAKVRAGKMGAARRWNKKSKPFEKINRKPKP